MTRDIFISKQSWTAKSTFLGFQESTTGLLTKDTVSENTNWVIFWMAVLKSLMNHAEWFLKVPAGTMDVTQPLISNRKKKAKKQVKKQ
jgi:hypothetical protein